MTDTLAQALPPLRGAIDLFPIQDGPRRMFCLRDRTDPTGQPVVLNEAALQIAALFDGQRTAGMVRSAFLLAAGVAPTEDEVRRLAAQLDEANLLDSPAFRRRLGERVAAYRRSEARAAVHAGRAYPGAPGELTAFLDGLFLHPDGPGGRPESGIAGPVRGVIAPHIDLHRGGPTYAWTYRALAEAEPVELYVLLGTCHTPMGTALAATRKPYDTPLGPATVDERFLELLETAYPGDLYADEFSHEAEHSVEFQVLFLRYLGLVGAGRGAIVPLLCGSLHQWVEPTDSPLASAEVRAALGALAQALARFPGRVCLVAGADLAHIGPQFGDPSPVDPAFSARVERADREMLELVCRGDAEGFFRQVMADHDARRICGLSPIYYLLSLIRPVEGRLIKYSQWVDPSRYGSVTYAGVIFRP